MHRCYIAPENWQPDGLTATRDEAHHLDRVLRLKRGDTVSCFDGQGWQVEARIESVRPEFTLKALAEPVCDSPPAPRVTLYAAVVKGKRMDWLVEKATELGVAGLSPVLTERTIVRLDAAAASARARKWQQAAVEACRQCGQNHVPIVDAPKTFSETIRQFKDHGLVIMGDLTAGVAAIADVLGQARGDGVADVAILTGPEGDFTGDELAAARCAGATGVSFGPLVLRAETAAIFALSAVRALF